MTCAFLVLNLIRNMSVPEEDIGEEVEGGQRGEGGGRGEGGQRGEGGGREVVHILRLHITHSEVYYLYLPPPLPPAHCCYLYSFR